MQMRAAQAAESSAASRRRKNKEGAWDALSVVQVAAWHGELTFALMTFRMDRPHANPNPLGTINPLRFGNSSGKSGCPLWLGKIGESAETFGGPVNALFRSAVMLIPVAMISLPTSRGGSP